MATTHPTGTFLKSKPQWLLALAGVLAFVLMLFAGARLALGSMQPRLTGTSLGKSPAPDFHLRDASGRATSLDQFHGKVVVLTFLYTNCTDTCPLEAEMLRHADEAAGHPADVQYLAVSVDPIGDTAANIAKFDAEHQLGELGSRWRYLIGTRDELSTVWHSYGIYAPVQPVAQGASNHSVGIYLIDKQGRERRYEDPDITAEELARDTLILARE
jgi:protein SCO1